MRDDGRFRVVVSIDALLADRGMTATELARRVGITLANLSILKNGRAKAIRLTTLAAVCRELECQPGEILQVVAVDEGADSESDV